MSVNHSQSREVAVSDIEVFLDELRQWLLGDAAHLVELFDVFAQEARVARKWLSPSLDELPTGSQVLEIGAGLMLLSCQIQREGFAVTALEPIAAEFSVFSDLQRRVLEYSGLRGYLPRVLPIPVEKLDALRVFAFAYSVNVMEHVSNVPVAISRVTEALVPGGTYRFTCPNYWFPYEPHFNIPTLLSKSLTGTVFRRTIMTSTRVTDPFGTWASLNWISVYQIRRVVARLDDIKVTFSSDLLVRTLERLGTDQSFAMRRSAWVRALVAIVVKFGLHRLAGIVSPLFQPIIDCRVSRTDR